MKTNWNWVQTIFASLGGFFGWFFGVGSPGGSFDGFLYALLVFVVVDYLTGVICAIADKKLSSEVGFKGICKKVLIFVMVGVAHIMDIYLIGNGEVLRTAVIFFYCSNEGVSMLENAAHLGLPIPEKLKAALEQLHGRSDDSSRPGDGV